jgi:hypothetical protein
LGSAIACRRAARFGVSPTTGPLPRCTRPDEIADHHQAGGNADPRAQGNAGKGVELGHRFNERQSRLDRTLGVVLVGLRIAEISEHPIAHILGDEPSIALHQLRAAALIGAKDAAQVLRIELRRQCGRADEVDEHHGELPALGGLRVRASRHRGWRNRGRAGVRNRLEQALAMPQRHTELFEIALGQLPEHLDVYFVVAENGLVAAKPEAAQPITDVHARVSTAPPR